MVPIFVPAVTVNKLAEVRTARDSPIATRSQLVTRVFFRFIRSRIATLDLHMPFPIYQIDAFTSEPFRGNPAAVVVMDEDRPTTWMQQVAAENNLSETAFVRHQNDNRYALRWFTPGLEVDLCGHATVATAHVLWTETGVTAEQIVFESRSGDLPVSRVDDRIQLDFPATPPEACEVPTGLVESFQFNGETVAAQFVGRSRFDYFVVLDRESQIRELDVDFRRLLECECRGVIVTAVADAEADYDFVSRFFGPAAGVDEDPVTGSAHCCLAVYWAGQIGRTDLRGYQASARGGMVTMELNEDRVLLQGNAVTVLRGELLV